MNEWTRHSVKRHSQGGRSAFSFQLLLILAFLASLLGMHPAEPVRAASASGIIWLAATADTWMRSSDPTWNYGADQSLSVVYDSGGAHQGALLKWDLNVLPAGITINSASVRLNIIDSSANPYNMYRLLRSWTEGTNNGVAGSGASWTYTDAGTTPWGAAGAQDTTSDRDTTSMWSASLSTLGDQTFALNATGLTAVQGWYSAPASNYGVTIQNYSSGTSGDYFVFDSREGARPPTLIIAYTANTPSIGDRVWYDADSDGIQDVGEFGLRGIIVNLRNNSNGSLVATTTTNSAGLYSFSNPPSGTYYIEFIAPTGYVISAIDQGGDDNLDSDAAVATGRTASFSWTAGGTADVSLDAGMSRVCTTITSRVNSNPDDGQEIVATGNVTHNGNTLPIASGATAIYWATRFQNINIPQGATIVRADITFRSTTDQSGVNGVTNIYGEAADTTNSISGSAYNISNRPRTAAYVTWNIASIFANVDFQSYQIREIVQEIVNRANWASGNSMVMIGVPGSATNLRTAITYNDSSTYAPLLTVTYCTTLPSAVNLADFRAYKTISGVQLYWETFSELDLVGFNLYRRQLSGDYARLNADLIPAQTGGLPEGNTYGYLDASALQGQTYEYKLEVIDSSQQPGEAKILTFRAYSFSLPLVLR